MPERKAGPVFDIAHSVLAGRDGYRTFQKGGSGSDYNTFLDSIASELVAAGLPAEDVHFAKRYPRCPESFVDDELARLASCGILSGTAYDKQLWTDVLARMNGLYSHGSFQTYIYPEEARLLFAAADIARPRSAIFLGSYYGYWAHAALSAIAKHGGRAVLVDPDPAAQEVASRNVSSAGLAGSVEIAVTTGERYADESNETYDFVVLDAEGPRDHTDPEQRGKRIYRPLLRHILPRMRKEALLVCHNILLRDIAGCNYFDGIVERNRDELGAFLNLANRELPMSYECTSTEGVGFWRRKTTPI